MASIRVNKCLIPLTVGASGNSAVSLFLNNVTFFTSTKIFWPFFSNKKSNLVSLLKKTSGFMISLFLSSFIRLFLSPCSTIRFAKWVFTPTKFFLDLIISRTYLIFLVQIQNMKYFKIAKDIDEKYYKNYLIAKKAGVNFLAYRCDISSKKIFIDKKLKIIDDWL